MRLIFIVPIFYWFCRITQFSMTEPQFASYPLSQMGQFMKKSFYIQLLRHVGLKFNNKVSWAAIITNNVAISNNVISFQPMMNNFNTDFVPWKEVIQKPRGNILTDDFRITITRMINGAHRAFSKA